MELLAQIQKVLLLEKAREQEPGPEEMLGVLAQLVPAEAVVELGSRVLVSAAVHRAEEKEPE
jgi:hypothetical protein